MTEQEKMIAKIERSMRNWITEQLPTYEQLEPAQEVKSTQGDYVLKANPAAQEIRAAFKDYCYIVKTQKELSDGNNLEDAEKSVDYFRSRLKVAT